MRAGAERGAGRGGAEAAAARLAAGVSHRRWRALAGARRRPDMNFDAIADRLFEVEAPTRGATAHASVSDGVAIVEEGWGGGVWGLSGFCKVGGVRAGGWWSKRTGRVGLQSVGWSVSGIQYDRHNRSSVYFRVPAPGADAGAGAREGAGDAAVELG